jgi:hypothetical protein
MYVIVSLLIDLYCVCDANRLIFSSIVVNDKLYVIDGVTKMNRNS